MIVHLLKKNHVTQMKQINPRYPGSESLHRMDVGKEEEESIQQLFILLGFICRLQLFSWCLCKA